MEINTLLEVLLICPKCGHNFTWTSHDFENWVECEYCGYGDEAWFYWHSLYPPLTIVKFGGARYEVFTTGAHYSNDALQLSREEFVEQMLGRSRLWHGGGPYMWIERCWYPQPDNPNNGSIHYEILIDEYSGGDIDVVQHTLQETLRKLLVGIEAVKSLPKPEHTQMSI